jgi:hypothetical protein
MDIRQLHTEDLRYSVPAVHPRLAVIKASADQRPGLVLAGQATASAIVVDRTDTEAAVAADARRRQEAHARAVAAQQAQLDAATANLDEAEAHEAEAEDLWAAAAQAVATFDQLAAEVTHADARRERAWTDRRSALHEMVEAVDQLERVQDQRRQAASALKEAEARSRDTRHPGAVAHTRQAGVDPAAEQLQAHIVALHAALDKAEEERQAQATATQEELVLAMTAVSASDTTMADLWERLGQFVTEELLSRWGHGHPEPGMIAEQRTVMVAAEEATERVRSHAAAAAMVARHHRDDEAGLLDALDGPGAEPSRVLDALRIWLAGIAAAHATTGPEPAPVILDDPFAQLEPVVRTGLIETLAGLSARTQLLYLTDQVDVLAWAISLPDDIGRIDHVVTASLPVLALTE